MRILMTGATGLIGRELGKRLAARGDELVCLVQAAMRHGPSIKAFVQASAIGFYGDRGDEALDAGSAPGRGFLAEVVGGWEADVDRIFDHRASRIAERFAH